MREMKRERKRPDRVRRRQRGLTLVELLVVLAILVTITGLVVINVLPEAEKSRIQATRLEIKQIESALDQYRLDMFSYPTTDQGLRALATPPADAPSAAQYRPGGYLKEGIPEDPWGNPYQYRFPGDHGVFDIWSYGADGREGGEDGNADIGNWKDDA